MDGSVGGLTTSVLTNSPGATIGGNGTNFGVFNADGIINPGDPASIGTFSTANGLTVYANGSLTFDLNSGSTTAGSGINDLLQITGDLTVNNTPIAVNIQGGLPVLGSTKLVAVPVRKPAVSTAPAVSVTAPVASSSSPIALAPKLPATTIEPAVVVGVTLPGSS